ncbi:MAG: acyl carrier protein [Candidatus Competibacterales bacterium]
MANPPAPAPAQLIDELEHIIVERHLKGVPPEGFDRHYPLLDHGVLDSLGMINLIGYLEQRYAVVFEDHEILPGHFASIQALGDLLAGKLKE